MQKFKELLRAKAAVRQRLLDTIGAEGQYAAMAELLRGPGSLPSWRKGDDNRRVCNLAFAHLGHAAYLQATASVTDRMKVTYVELKQEQRWLNTQLERLAPHVRVCAAASWNLYDEVWTSTYRSQGFGATSYARGRAEIRTLDLLTAGLEARVRMVGEDFHVEGKATKSALEVIRRRPPVPLRTMVKACWARGCNPRVYMPLLPQGYEAGVGLDYFGGETC